MIEYIANVQQLQVAIHFIKRLVTIGYSDEQACLPAQIAASVKVMSEVGERMGKQQSLLEKACSLIKTCPNLMFVQMGQHHIKKFHNLSSGVIIYILLKHIFIFHIISKHQEKGMLVDFALASMLLAYITTSGSPRHE